MLDIIKCRYVDYPLTLLALILFILVIHYRIRNKTVLMFLIILSLISRIFQYALLIQSLQKNYKLDISIMLSYFVTHFTLFTTLYYYNYVKYGSGGFLYSGSPTTGNDVENVRELKSKIEFEKNIGINLLNYTASVTFLVGHNEIGVNTTFGKWVNIFNMIDSVSLLGFLVGFIYSSIKRIHKR